nr:ABC transporter permease [Pseudomonas sp.]
RVPLKMVAKRLLAIPVSIFVIATLTFFLIRASGSDAAATIAGEYADEAAIETVREQLGLNQGVWTQYAEFVGGLLRGDLGVSYYSKAPVAEDIMARLPLDVTHGVLALVIASILGTAAGAAAAYKQDRWPDSALRIAVSALQSIPDYVFALVAIFVFFFLLGWLPAPIGQVPIGVMPPESVTGVVLIDSVIAGQWETVGAAFRQMLLPVLSIGIVLSAAFAKVVRSSFTTVLGSAQIQYAKACGLTPFRVFRSAFAVSRSAILTTVSIVVGVVLGGGAILQKIFTLDGAAAYSVDAIFRLDLPAIQGTVIVFGSLTVLVFLLVDILILLSDPRVRQRG